LVARSREGLSTIAGGLHHEPITLDADLGDAAVPSAVARWALDGLGGVDVLVNNAAAAARLDTVDTDAALIDQLLAVNVRAPLLLVGALIPSMVKQGRGSIINLSLASDAARFVTGETISVDGGMARTFDLFGGSV
jgi:NAD(P)-dependent dehydrogenase (short-subunit alcohol dehydrogenase family)